MTLLYIAKCFLKGLYTFILPQIIWQYILLNGKNEIRLWLLLKHVRDLNLTLRIMKSLWRFLEENWGSRAQDLSRGSNLICKKKNAIMVVGDLLSIFDPSKPTVALWKSHFPLWVGIFPTLNYDILYSVSMVFQPYSYRTCIMAMPVDMQRWMGEISQGPVLRKKISPLWGKVPW